MELLERIIVGLLFGVPGVAIIAGNYSRIFKKNNTSSPAYGLGGILTAAAVLAILGDRWKQNWYFILFPIGLDMGLCMISFVISYFRPQPNYAKMYLDKMRSLGWDTNEAAEVEFNKYYKECLTDTAYKDIARNKKYDLKRFSYIVAGLKTSKYLRCRENEPFNIKRLWDVTDEEFEILKDILPEELKSNVFRAIKEENNGMNQYMQ